MATESFLRLTGLGHWSGVSRLLAWQLSMFWCHRDRSRFPERGSLLRRNLKRNRQKERENRDTENLLLMVNSASLLNQDIKCANIMYINGFI